MESTLEQALVFAKQGAVLEPENQLTRAALALVHFFRNERELFLSEAEIALALNPNAPAIIGFLGWLLRSVWGVGAGAGHPEKRHGVESPLPGLISTSRRISIFYHQGRYGEAYREAQQFQMPQLFWDPLLRAGALGQLRKEREAGEALAELLRLRPDFPTMGPFLIGHYVKSDSLAAALLDGLRKAGLHI